MPLLEQYGLKCKTAEINEAAACASRDAINNTMTDIKEAVLTIKAAVPSAFILVHAYTGLPENIDGKVVFLETPQDMVKYVPALIETGANIIGCGTTPDYICAIKNAIPKHPDC